MSHEVESRERERERETETETEKEGVKTIFLTFINNSL